MASVNKVILIGNVGQDPDIRFTPSGDAVGNFSVATTDIWKDKEGKKQERTEWHRIVVYRKLAEIVEAYVKKGSSVYVAGHISSKKYTDKQGVDRVSFEIVAEELRLLDKKQDGIAPAKEPEKANGFQPDANFDEMADDIPF